MNRILLVLAFSAGCSNSGIEGIPLESKGAPAEFFDSCLTIEVDGVLQFSQAAPQQQFDVVGQCGPLQVVLNLDDPSGGFAIDGERSFTLDGEEARTVDLSFIAETAGRFEAQLVVEVGVDGDEVGAGVVELVGEHP